MKILTYCLALLLASLPVMAAGIGAAPSHLTFNVEEGGKQKRELTVYNLDDNPLEFEVKSQAPFLKFHHNSTIEPRGSNKIIVEANAKNLKKGNHTGYVNIFRSNGIDGVQLKIGTAVKASVSVTPTDKASAIVGMALFFSMALLGGLLAYLSSIVIRSMLGTARQR